MADLTKSNLYKITAWRDNSVKIVLTVGEGSNAANPTYNKSINFRLYEPGKDTLTIPDSGVDITLAIERPDGETDIIAGSKIAGTDSDISFPVKNTMTACAGIVKGEIRIVSSSSVVKFYGINFNVYKGVSDSAIEQSAEFDALTKALQKVINLTGDGTIANLDTVIQHSGTNPVSSGIIYDFIESTKTTLEKYENANNIDNAVAGDTVYKVYTNADGLTVTGYHRLIAVPATSQITQYLFSQGGDVLFRTCAATNGQQSGSWGTWAKFSKAADVYTKTETDSTYQTIANKSQSIDTNRQTTTEDAQKYPSVAAIKTFLYGNFYTETEIDDMLALIYSKTESDNKYATKTELNTKANAINSRFALHLSVGFDSHGVPVKMISGTSIPSGAFTDNEVTKIFISQDVQTIQGGAFSSCPNLTDIYFDSTSTTYDSSTIPSGVNTHTLDNYHVMNCILDVVSYLESTKANKSDVYTKTQSDSTYQTISNKSQAIDSSRLTTTEDATKYPSVAAIKDFSFGNFYDKDEIDEEFTHKTPVEFTITLDKDSWENQQQIINIPTSSYVITENTRLVNFTIENLEAVTDTWVICDLSWAYGDEYNNQIAFNVSGYSCSGEGTTDHPPIDIEIKFILMEVNINAATQ